MEESCEILRTAIKAQCDVSFRQHEKLREAVKVAVDDRLAVYAANVTKAVAKRLAREARPFTQNHYYMQTLNKLRATAQQLRTIQDQPVATSLAQTKERHADKQKAMQSMMEQLELAQTSAGMAQTQSRRGATYTLFIDSYHQNYSGENPNREQWTQATMLFSNDTELTLTLEGKPVAEDRQAKKTLVFNGAMGTEKGLSLTCLGYEDVFLSCSEFNLVECSSQSQNLSVIGASSSFKTALSELGMCSDTRCQLHRISLFCVLALIPQL